MKPVWVKVVSRRPHAFYRDEKHKDYLIVYVTETFDCGHSEDFNFLDAAEPLTAKHRLCHECSGVFGALKIRDNKRLALIAEARDRRAKRIA